MTQRIFSMFTMAMLLVVTMSGCGADYEIPSGQWVKVTSSLSHISSMGVAAYPVSTVLNLNRITTTSTSTQGAITSYQGATTSPSSGTYFMQNPVLPARWRFTWVPAPCQGQFADYQLNNFYETHPIECRGTPVFAFNYSQTNTGQYVFTGGNDKLVDVWNGTMHPNQCRTSADGRYNFCYQSDGNLVFYDGSQALWASNTSGTTPGRAVMQSDGNMVVYDGSNVPRWASNTSGAGNFIVVQSNRCALMYNANLTSIPWGTSSCVAPGSSTTQQAPIAPINVASSVSGSTVSLSWTAPPGPVGDYVLEAGTSPGLANVGTFYLSSQPYTTFYGVAAGTYWVQLTARNNGGTSPPSNPIVIVVY